MAIFRTRMAPVAAAATPAFGPGMAPVAPGTAPVAVVPLAEVDAETRPDSGEAVGPERWCWIWTGILIGAGVALGSWSHDHWAEAVAFTPPVGINVFALFYVIAQTIERIQEPFTPFVKGKKTEESEVNEPEPGPAGGGPSVTQRQAQALLERRTAVALAEPTSPNTKGAANAKRTSEQVSANITLLLFGTSSFLAMVAAGVLKAALLKTVGVSGIAVWIDVTITGLAIGGGTKPLHDLISNLTEAKEEKKDAKLGTTP